MTVAFTTNVYQQSWKDTLLTDYIREQLAIFNYPFDEYIITINNVDDADEVKAAIEERFPDFQYFYAPDDRSLVMEFFGLTEEDWVPGYWYSINNYCALMRTKCDYLLHLSEDCYMVQPGNNFVADSVAIMNGNDKFVSSMPSWDKLFIGPRNEADMGFNDKNFWGGYGFSDQIYFIKTRPFLDKGIWHFQHQESDRFPVVGSFEKRVDAYMRNMNKWRLIHKKSWYDHDTRSGHLYKLISGAA